jgi:hypothetical protein
MGGEPKVKSGVWRTEMWDQYNQKRIFIKKEKKKKNRHRYESLSLELKEKSSNRGAAFDS